MRRWVLQTIPVFLLSFIFTSFPPSLYLWNSHLASDILFSPPPHFISLLCYSASLQNCDAVPDLSFAFFNQYLLSVVRLLFGKREHPRTGYDKISQTYQSSPPHTKTCQQSTQINFISGTLWEVCLEHGRSKHSPIYTLWWHLLAVWICIISPHASVRVINVIQNKGQFKNKK